MAGRDGSESGLHIIRPDELDECFQGRWHMAPAGVVQKESAWRCFPFLEYLSEMSVLEIVACQLLIDVGNTGTIFRRLDHQRIVFQNERACDRQTYRLTVCLIFPSVKLATGKTSGNAGMFE